MKSQKFNRLELVAAERAGHKGPRRSPTSARRFLDFHIDGRSLRDLVADANDTVTPLCRDWGIDSVVLSLRTLRGDARQITPGLDIGEAEMLVCAECGDLGCGALIAKVEVAERVVIWREFRWVQASEPAKTRTATATTAPSPATSTTGPKVTPATPATTIPA